MKKLFKTLTVLLLASATTIASVANNKMAIKEIDTFSVGMYKLKDSPKVRLLLDKLESNIVTVELSNEAGQVIHREFISRKKTKYSKNFDMSNLQDGKYTFAISDKQEKIIHEVTLATNEPIQQTQRTIKIN